MKLWDVSEEGRPWSVELDVRDLGGHLDFTGRTAADTLSERVKDATHGVAADGALPLGFHFFGLVRGKCLPAGLHALEASCVSASSLSAFRFTIVRSIWSSEMPLSNTSVFLNLLDGPGGVDRLPTLSGKGFALCVGIWSTVAGSSSHFPIDCSWAPWPLVMRLCVCFLFLVRKLGLSGDGEQQGWIRAALPPLRMFSGQSNIFRVVWQLKISDQLAGARSFWTSEDLYNYLSLPTCGKEMKCCQGPFIVGVFSFWGKLRRGCQVPFLRRLG